MSRTGIRIFFPPVYLPMGKLEHIYKTVGRFLSVRVGSRYRALAAPADGDLVWFWIGSLADYNAIV